MGYHNPNEKPGSIIPCNQFARVLLFQLRVVPARGGAEVALKICIYIYVRPFSSIELACAVRQPSPCVRALCETGVLFHQAILFMAHVVHLQAFHRTRLPGLQLPTAMP